MAACPPTNDVPTFLATELATLLPHSLPTSPPSTGTNNLDQFAAVWGSDLAAAMRHSPPLPPTPATAESEINSWLEAPTAAGLIRRVVHPPTPSKVLEGEWDMVVEVDAPSTSPYHTAPPFKLRLTVKDQYPLVAAPPEITVLGVFHHYLFDDHRPDSAQYHTLLQNLAPTGPWTVRCSRFLHGFCARGAHSSRHYYHYHYHALTVALTRTQTLTLSLTLDIALFGLALFVDHMAIGLPSLSQVCCARMLAVVDRTSLPPPSHPT
jgi:hypothetical protein